LLERRWDHPELPGLLVDLAGITARQRVPFFGPLLDVLWSDEPAAKVLRPQVLACLADADGHLVVEAIVSALADDDTREAATRTLRGVAVRQPARWIHALMHPNEAVRLLAVAEPPPDPARPFELYALPTRRSARASWRGPRRRYRGRRRSAQCSTSSTRRSSTLRSGARCFAT
jgi:hypothetical protein